MAARTEDDWGEMVLPGVFMLRRKTAPLEKRIVGLSAGSTQFEILLHEIEVIETHIDKLKKSNAEIREYLKEAECRKENLAISCTSGGDISVCEPENDDGVFEDAIAENEALISCKEKELAELSRLIQSNRCACSYNSGKITDAEIPVTDDTGRTDTVENVMEEEEDEEEEEEGCEEDMSNARFCL
ncbi:hypothetical protein DQ04_03751080 [Trypanosoma grayi]|uniref:hypothetical protein n=1 Tax=Trypanosoma grayi TaxID=71804 RepID=UPI0004F42386|nr:hypothetical protein DQ04_03751080 [Trypanosoma grayi]KEG10405.1 hypothetical protein DQ04_03751080 [Trypanosoma grayi]